MKLIMMMVVLLPILCKAQFVTFEVTHTRYVEVVNNAPIDSDFTMIDRTESKIIYIDIDFDKSFVKIRNTQVKPDPMFLINEMHSESDGGAAFYAVDEEGIDCIVELRHIEGVPIFSVFYANAIVQYKMRK